MLHVILYTTIWVALQHTILCYLYKIQHHHELLPDNFFRAFAFQKITEDDDWLSNVLWTNEAHFTLWGSATPINAEFQILKIPELSCKLHCITRKSPCGVDLPHLLLLGPFSSKKCVILVLKLLAWHVRGSPICYRITSSLSWLIKTSCKAWLLCRIALHPMLLNRWKMSCAGRLVMITSVLVMQDSTGLEFHHLLHSNCPCLYSCILEKIAAGHSSRYSRAKDLYEIEVRHQKLKFRLVIS